jgi:hypothetical protein
MLAIAGLLAINAAVGVRADTDCYNCPIGNVCMQLTQGQGGTTCIPLDNSCTLGDSCTVNP